MCFYFTVAYTTGFKENNIHPQVFVEPSLVIRKKSERIVADSPQERLLLALNEHALRESALSDECWQLGHERTGESINHMTSCVTSHPRLLLYVTEYQSFNRMLFGF